MKIENILLRVLIIITLVIIIYSSIYKFNYKNYINNYYNKLDELNNNKNKQDNNQGKQGNNQGKQDKSKISKSLKVYNCSNYTLNEPTKHALSILFLELTKKLNNEIALYLPCGYTKVELELNRIRFADSVIDNEYFLSNKVILGILGCDKLCSKNEIWNKLSSNYGVSEAEKIIPLTYLVNDQNDIARLRTENNYMNGNIYILKNNEQGKKGLYLTNNIISLLDSKELKNYKIIQRYITNPYLINNRKLNIRLYILLINRFNKPTEWYIYNYGKCIYNNKDYDIKSSLNNDNIDDKEQHFTSLNLDYDYVYNKMGNPESLEDLKHHLGVNDYNFVFNKIIYKLNNIKDVYSNELINKDNLCNVEKLNFGYKFFCFL